MAGVAQIERADERRQRIVELSGQGLTAATIADKLGVTTRTVERARAHAGLNTPRRDGTEGDKLRAKLMLCDGCSYVEVGRTIGFDPGTIALWHPGYQFTYAQMGEASAMSRELRRLERIKPIA